MNLWWLLPEGESKSEKTHSHVRRIHHVCIVGGMSWRTCAGARSRLLRRCVRGPLRRAARTRSRHHCAGIGLESPGDFKEECRGPYATDTCDSGDVWRWESILRNRKSRRRRSVFVGTVDRISWRYAARGCGLLLRSESHSTSGSRLSQSRCPGLCGSRPRTLPPRSIQGSWPRKCSAGRRKLT